MRKPGCKQMGKRGNSTRFVHESRFRSTTTDALDSLHKRGLPAETAAGGDHVTKVVGGGWREVLLTRLVVHVCKVCRALGGVGDGGDGGTAGGTEATEEGGLMLVGGTGGGCDVALEGLRGRVSE